MYALKQALEKSVIQSIDPMFLDPTNEEKGPRLLWRGSIRYIIECSLKGFGSERILNTRRC